MARQFVCTRTEPVVKTKAGLLHGFILDGIYTFHGIKYADADRFQLPREVAPWEGIKEATNYGYVCPLLKQENPSNELMVPHRYWPMSEHCQYLNVWTQSVDPEAKKPVMVWIHGGGFSAGSSIEQVAYEGDSLCREGDVVMVSINHRLNILGYMDLSPFGEKYKNSGNAGNADIVMALRWIKDNIAAFGGDPDNVTLFGQSGGGGKICTLLQTPSADGLFHKGIIQSGVMGRDTGMMPDGKTNGVQIVNAVLKELGFAEDDVGKLETVPYRVYADAYNKVAPALKSKGIYTGCAPIPDDFYLGDILDIGFTEHAKTVPIMVGSVLGEFAFSRGLDKYKATDDEIINAINAKYGQEGGPVLTELFNAAYPEKHYADILVLDSRFRGPTKEFIKTRSFFHEAPVFAYLFAYEFPIDGGKPAWHCSELPFVFHNANRVPVCNEEGVTDKLEEQLSSAWLSFAKTGTPNSECLPEWSACVDGKEATMVFDKQSVVRYNYDDELIAAHEKYAPPFVFHAEPVQH